MTGPDPASDPQVRWRAQHALNLALAAAADILHRRTDRTGAYLPPSDVGEFGDVSGLIQVGELQVLGPLADAVEQARLELAAVRDLIEADRRARYGEHWKPPAAAA